ncbi:MAG: hypothetical protein CL460_03645 [Acidimicrobiaceae bacterium]|nr:hypothetical protein [Acidimicrobiaceae bacterium]
MVWKKWSHREGPVGRAGEARVAVCPVHSVDRRRESQRMLDVAEKGANVTQPPRVCIRRGV